MAMQPYHSLSSKCPEMFLMIGLNWTLKHLNLSIYTVMSTGVLGIPVQSTYIFSLNVLRFPKHSMQETGSVAFWELEIKEDIIGHLKWHHH